MLASPARLGKGAFTGQIFFLQIRFKHYQCTCFKQKIWQSKHLST